MHTDRITVLVWRGGEIGNFKEYNVPRRKVQMVLDVVTHIQKVLDPGLSYRFACRVGVCGSCAMTINGKAQWTCRTHVDQVIVRNRIKIEPLRSFPILKDLTVDMSGFFEKFNKADAVFKPTSTRHDQIAEIKPGEKMRQSASEAIECIGCGVCYANCDVAKWNPEYLGPAALNRNWTLVNDVRDIIGNRRLLSISGDSGCHACHSHQTCSNTCPKHINLTKSIANLKRLSAWAILSRKL